MAIKRRSKNEDDEDDEERPRRKSRQDEDEEDDDDRPAKRRRSREEEADDDDDRPVKRRKSRDEEADEDEERPANRRKTKDEEEDQDRPARRRKTRDEEGEDEEDERPAKRRKPRQEEEDDGARPPKRPKRKAEEDQVDELEDLDELDDLDDLDEGEPSYEEQLKEYNRKKLAFRKQMEAMSEGLGIFRKRIQFLLTGWMAGAGTLGLAFLAKYMVGDELFGFALFLPYLVGLAMSLGIPFLGIKAVNLCKQGPPKTVTATLNSILSMNAAAFLIGILAWILSFIIESVYLKNVARYLKEKIQGDNAHSVMIQHILVEIVAPFILGGAYYFLITPGLMLGYIFFGIIAAVWVLFYIKVFTEMMSIISGLQITIEKRLKAEDTPEW